MRHWTTVVGLSTVAWFCIFVVGFMAFDADLVGLEPLIKIPESYQTGHDCCKLVNLGRLCR